jgi:S1-C subfamily serine protease
MTLPVRFIALIGLLWVAAAAGAGAPFPNSSAATTAPISPAVAADSERSANPNTDRIYAEARPSLLQVRTLLQSADKQSTLGSGFLVGADGLIVTNYHVVSQYALEPSTYRLEYAAPDGSSGKLSLLAIDVADDLAVVKMEPKNLPFLNFDERALHNDLQKGERLYSMGNPLDLGFTIVEGTYNGGVERSYNERIHFTGAINPGMSGGPTVTVHNHVVGINVARQLEGELVSFLVPARFAAALVERARSGPPLELAHARDEIGRQLATRQTDLYAALERSGFNAVGIGGYRAPESAAPWFTCWANTNADALPKPRGLIDSTRCTADTSLFIAEDLQAGSIQLSHAYLRSSDLNSFQFSSLLSRNYAPLRMPGGWSSKRLTTPRCHEDFVGDGTHRPLLYAAWCARAYRDFSGLYDVVLTAVTQDRSSEALSVQLQMQGVGYDAAQRLGRHFLDTLAWTR